MSHNRWMSNGSGACLTTEQQLPNSNTSVFLLTKRHSSSRVQSLCKRMRRAKTFFHHCKWNVRHRDKVYWRKKLRAGLIIIVITIKKKHYFLECVCSPYRPKNLHLKIEPWPKGLLYTSPDLCHPVRILLTIGAVLGDAQNFLTWC